jgi:hypothetical protein
MAARRLRALQKVCPDPARKVIVETNADPRLPWGAGIFDVHDGADCMQFHAARPVAFDEADLCSDLQIHPDAPRVAATPAVAVTTTAGG